MNLPARLLVGGLCIFSAHLYFWPRGLMVLGLVVDAAGVALILFGGRRRGSA